MSLSARPLYSVAPELAIAEGEPKLGWAVGVGGMGKAAAAAARQLRGLSEERNSMVWAAGRRLARCSSSRGPATPQQPFDLPT